MRSGLSSFDLNVIASISFGLSLQGFAARVVVLGGEESDTDKQTPLRLNFLSTFSNRYS